MPAVTHLRHHAAGRQRRGWRPASSTCPDQWHNKPFVPMMLTQKVVLQFAGGAGKGSYTEQELAPALLLPSRAKNTQVGKVMAARSG